MNPAPAAPFGQVLRRLRLAAALSQEALAARAGLSPRTISDLERGIHRAPYPETVRLLVEALAVDDDARTRLVAAAAGARAPDLPANGFAAEPRVANPPAPSADFVGREREVALLRGKLSAALAGQGGVVLVAGEPGVGKTRLAEEIAAEARERGAQVLWGRCWEGEGAPAFWPWIQIVRTLVLDCRPDSERPELTQLVPELGERSPHPPLPADPEQARFRLYDAITQQLRSPTRAAPLLLVLEDLHWADEASLLLLRFLAQQLGDARLLVVGTYRDVELDPRHPLSDVVASLRRERTFISLRLQGLDERGVHDLLEAALGPGIASQVAVLAAVLRRETGGNPFFVQEIVRHLQETGRLYQQDGRWIYDASAIEQLQVPQGVREVIQRRLARLAPATYRLLEQAAVLGPELDQRLLARLSGLDEETLEECLAEASTAQLVRERDNRAGTLYEFHHALIRQVLYEGLRGAQRRRLHQLIARALEQAYTGRLEEHASELAEHFARAGAPADHAKAVHYSLLAAERAGAVYAYSEVVRLLEQALQAQMELDASDTLKRCDLLLALSEALLAAGEPLRVVESVAPEALALAERLGDRQRASRACQAALDAIWRQRGATGWTTPLSRQWAGQADRYAAPETTDRVRADAAMALVAYHSDQQREAWALQKRALALARRLGDAEGIYQVGWLITGGSYLPEHEQERHRLAEELFRDWWSDAHTTAAGRLMYGCWLIFLGWGEQERCGVVERLLRETAARTRDNFLTTATAECDITRLVFDGRLEEAVVLGESLRRRAEEIGVPGFGAQIAFRTTLWPFLHLGRAEQVLVAGAGDAQTAAVEGRSLLYGSVSALALANLGRWEEARRYLGRLRRWLPAADHGAGMNLSARVHWLVVATLAGDRELVAGLRQGLDAVAALIVASYPTCIARHLGAAAALLLEREQARRYYEQALEVAGTIGFRPELALARLQLAELLVTGATAERAAAQAHIDLAIAELHAMNMQPALARALALVVR